MCSPIDRKRQSVDQFLVGNHLVLTGRDTGRYSPSFGLLDLLLPAMRAGLLARFLLQGLGWWGARKRGVPLPCVTSVYTTSSHAPQRSVTRLTTRNFNTGTRGFAAPEDSTTAVCILPGTELAFSAEVIYASRVYGWKTRTISSNTAIFRQINKDVPQVHHDALEFPDGTFVLLTYLHEGQQATVLQLPAQPKTPAEAKVQTRVLYVG